MDKEKVMDNVERWKVAADIFLRDDIRVFIKDASDNIYFGDIILVGEDTLTIECFAPEQRKGQKFILYWPLIVEFQRFEEREGEHAKG